MILTVIISFELAIFLFLSLFNRDLDYNFSNKTLELILTIYGLFSALLVTYFFNRITWILNIKSNLYEEAVEYSQKITEFRRICDKLTDNYNIWTDEDATKRLLEFGEFKYLDYYEYKLMSLSDYDPPEIQKNLIDKLKRNPHYRSDISDLFLGMISLVKDRKSGQVISDKELYKDFQKKGIYKLEFIEKCLQIGYTGRLGYWFEKNYAFINFHALSAKSKQYIIDASNRIDSKYKTRNLDNELLADICEDMNEHYFPELHKLLLDLRKGLSGINLIIFIVLIASLVFGVLLPFLIYFLVENSNLKNILTSILVSSNFGLLAFFIFNLYSLIKKEITWT